MSVYRGSRVSLGGCEFDNLSLADVADHVRQNWRTGDGGWILTVNVDILRRLERDKSFAELAEQATLRVADGMPIVWASRIAGTSLDERVAGADLLWTLSAAAAADDRTVFLLGGNPGAAEGASRALRARCSGLRIVGIESPPFGFETDESYLQRLETHLAAAKPDLLFVALGCPKQDQLIARLRRRLPSTWTVGVGIAFSFAAGDVRRAPTLLQKLSLEWVHRLVQEPRRLLRRYFVDDVPVAVALMSKALRTRATHSFVPARVGVHSGGIR